ncbi:MAG: transcription-repair coupling factor [Kiritimatiellia bacterium]
MNLIDKFRKPAQAILNGGNRCSVSPVPSSAACGLVLALQGITKKNVFWITRGPGTMERVYRDVLALEPYTEKKKGMTAGRLAEYLCYPAREFVDAEKGIEDPESAGMRLNAVLALEEARKRGGRTFTVSCIQAVTQNTLSEEMLRGRIMTLKTGGQADLEEIGKDLVKCGYEHVPEVYEKGRFSVKGGIVDIWPVTEPWPLRVELYGPFLESIRTFDPETQRSRDRLEAVRVGPAGETAAAEGGKPVIEYLGRDVIWVWSEPREIEAAAEAFAAAEPDKARYKFGEIEGMAAPTKGSISIHFESGFTDSTWDVALDFKEIAGVPAGEAGIAPDILMESRRKLVERLAKMARAGDSVLMLLDTAGGLHHFRSEFKDLMESAGPGMETGVGDLSGGFTAGEEGVIIAAESDLFGRRRETAARYERKGSEGARAARTGAESGGRVITGLTDMEPGDLVVHAQHGIGRYLGVYEITVDERSMEVLTVEYAGNAKLHVPVSQAHLLTRYVGVTRHRPSLHRLGGKRWKREKKAAEKSILDLASSMLEMQAQRSCLKGHAFAADNAWQKELEAAFPYRETQDQARVISEVKKDMESAQPMDRLVCGDAGYGKTEVALRAAFKAVMDGKQTAVVVPTTVLAQQHLDTFSRRLAAYPVRIEMLSRFRTVAEKNDVLKGLADGTVDIVIGTHALFQPRVRFHDLGLVIVDEEQRFGVRHKERLKYLRSLVDVLTLTATPIPRTLYMSLTGVREISLLQTPPMERMAIETIVAPDNDEKIRDAIRREIARQGQVFYIHNRVMTIERAKRRIERLVPAAVAAVAHGRMPVSELASVMREFVAGNIDVLVCTTIIESGMDIPRVNSIMIDRADRFGMADLYQLRGRVGRSGRRAYAFLLLPDKAPVDETARKRIDAVRKYSGLSAGFNIALRDLEIRGAGNVLGARQSGHIASIGFGLYCRLLKSSVAGLKGEERPPVADVDVRLDFISLSPRGPTAGRAAFIPYAYVEDERVRVRIYRKIAEVSVPEEAEELRVELWDRFGPLPPELGRLLKMAAIRAAAAQKGIGAVLVREGRLMLKKDGAFIRDGGAFPEAAGGDPDVCLDRIAGILEKLPAEKGLNSRSISRLPRRKA